MPSETRESNDGDRRGAISASSTPGRSRWMLLGLAAVAGIVTFVVLAVLVSIFERRQEARQPFVRLIEVDEATSDPEPWGVNWPYQYDTYTRTVDTSRTEYGGSSAMPESKLEKQPWLKRLYAGYAFSLDYREARGHAYMLYDQQVTERVTQRKQSGACLHCHASVIPTYRRLGLESLGQPLNQQTMAEQFNWTAVMEGFRLASTMDYETAHAQLLKTAGAAPASRVKATRSLPEPDPPAQTNPFIHHDGGEGHPVSCIDCHDPQTMQIRITRPGFIEGIAVLAASDEPQPHLPSIERWRSGDRQQDYDPNRDAERQEMRSFVCAQCHVEYYCASRETLFFPWENGLKAERIEQTFDEHRFPDGEEFYDYEHGETGAKIYKAQHPEFELWSQGIHARSGVSCSDCHMPYERQGAMKVSSHWVRSPMLSINRSCQTCHNVPEDELRQRVDAIQSTTKSLMERAADAMTEMLDAIAEAQASEATEDELAPILELQRKSMWRLDFISSENSLGFHADQEAARLLGESIDYSRQAQVQALRLRAPAIEIEERTTEPIRGLTPTEKSPVRSRQTQ